MGKTSYVKKAEILEVTQKELVVKITLDMDRLIVDFVNKVECLKGILTEVVKNMGKGNLREIVGDNVSDDRSWIRRRKGELS